MDGKERRNYWLWRMRNEWIRHASKSRAPAILEEGDEWHGKLELEPAGVFMISSNCHLGVWRRLKHFVPGRKIKSANKQ